MQPDKHIYGLQESGYLLIESWMHWLFGRSTIKSF